MAKRKTMVDESTADVMSAELMKLNDGIQEPKYFKTVNPIINIALSGSLDKGVPVGSMTQVIGPAGVGKSIFALMMATSFQFQHKDGIVILLNSEDGVPKDYLTSASIDMDRFIVKNINNVGDIIRAITAFKKAQAFEQPTFLIIDSISILPAEKDEENYEEGKGAGAFGVKAKELSQFFDNYTLKLREYGCTTVILNHTTEQMPTGFNAKAITIPRGGKASVNACFNIVQLTGKDLYNEKTKNIEGKEIMLTTFKSRVTRKVSSAETRLYYRLMIDGGLSATDCLFEIAFDATKVLHRSGAWYSVVDEDGVVIPIEIKEKDEDGEVIGTKLVEKFYKKDVDGDMNFYKQLKEKTNFSKKIEEYYSLNSGNPMITERMFEEIL